MRASISQDLEVEKAALFANEELNKMSNLSLRFGTMPHGWRQ